ncbi:MAG: Stp1/IreP family PP2C-type Ser/Thr phosphatase [Eubacteriales bacterium]|nr:Stp1/IreP family PP2C-type Ser/Thr phosphatase [Eubacteriales bacterium]
MQVSVRTDTGKTRTVNQDYVYSTTSPIGPLSNLFVVADGMGGYKSGDFASRFATEQLAECVTGTGSGDDVQSVLYRAFERADRALVEAAADREDLAGTGTTLVAATVNDGELTVGNVGDSRLYLFRNELEQITEDHNRVSLMLKNGQLTPEEARIHRDKNKITRAIGYHGLPDFFSLPVRSGDRLLICTDGLTNMVDDETIGAVLKRPISSGEICDVLIDLANEHGGEDNITVMLIDINGEVEAC